MLRKRKNEESCDEEILSLVNDYKEQGALEEEEVEMISNIMGFSDNQAGDIMTHRSKVDAIEKETTLHDALMHMLHGNYTRYPLYEETLDNVIGILYLKDLMLAYLEGGQEQSLSALARKPFYVPETMPIDTLFDQMQKKKIHMAVVIDEYGQTAGIVAMEDILEEIVGDILDEYDVEEVSVHNGENEQLYDGMVTLEELTEQLGIHFDEQDSEKFETLNGFLISRLEHIPEDGEQFEVVYAGYHFYVLDCENRKVSSVRIKKEVPAE